jgi:hypothetical protein
LKTETGLNTRRRGQLNQWPPDIFLDPLFGDGRF